MIKLVSRIAIALIGIGGLLLGAGALAAPGRIAARFGLNPEGPIGVGTVRGDLAGFFLVVGGFCLAAAWRTQGRFLIAPLALFAIALTGRAITAVQMGFDAQSIQFMTVEAFAVAMLLIGRSAFSR